MNPLLFSSVKRPANALSELDLAGLTAWATTRGLPPYRARQLSDALHRRAIQDVTEMTEFPVNLRDRIAVELPTRTLKVAAHLRSTRDRAEKVLFELHDGHSIESVLIWSPETGEKSRATVCVSSQVGCPAACSFCATGLGGFARNLSAGEIVDQVQFFSHQLRKENKHVNNVVFMGMGEPFLNTSSVANAIERLTDSDGIGLGERHITVSTVGIIPQIAKFAVWGGQVNLAISLHAPNDELRTRLVPYNRRFPITALLDAVQKYWEMKKRRVSFEYVLLGGVNDSPELSRQLGELLRPLQGAAHVNLIPWNPHPEGKFRRGDGPDATRFAQELRALGVNATIRYSKGLDISAACGQLRELATRPNV